MNNEKNDKSKYRFNERDTYLNKESKEPVVEQRRKIFEVIDITILIIGVLFLIVVIGQEIYTTDWSQVSPIPFVLGFIGLFMLFGFAAGGSGDL